MDRHSSKTTESQMRPHRIPYAQQPEVKRQIQMLKDLEIIKDSESPYASPILLVRKPNGVDFRMCVDYRRLNQQLCPATYVVPLMTDLVEQVAGHKLMSTFDLAMAFHQVPLAEEDKYKTGFITPFGMYEYLTVPFGIRSGAIIMTRVMESIRRYLTSACFIFIDDVCLASDSEEQHLKDLDQFFDVLERFNLKLKLDKCYIAREEVKYLGVLISAFGIRPCPKKIAALLSTRIPRTLTELRAFIGAVSYWRRFIKNFAKIMAPLYALTRKEGKQTDANGRIVSVIGRWSPECQHAFDEILEALTSAPVLAAPWIGHDGWII
ncbi:enzymatic polyprotein, partial [Aphelenchoides avenae]